MNEIYCKFPSRFAGATCPNCCFSLPRDMPSIPIALCGSITTCDGSPPKRQDLVALAAQYKSAVDIWREAGSPTRSQQEIDRILELCKACDHYVPGTVRSRCNLCGCSINSLRNGLLNKIAMATEGCPLSPPKWTAEAKARADRQTAIEQGD